MTMTKKELTATICLMAELKKKPGDINLGMIENCVNDGASLAVLFKPHMFGSDMTPLIAAIQKKREDVALLLIGAGAPLTREGNGTTTPLIEAATYDLRPLMTKLFEHGAPLDEADSSGECAVMKAVRGGHLIALDMLMKQGAALDVRNTAQMTPLDVAAASGMVHYPACLRLMQAEIARRQASDAAKKESYLEDGMPATKDIPSMPSPSFKKSGGFKGPKA